MAKSPVFKKCGCRVPVIGPDGAAVEGSDGKPKMRRAGAACPKLRRGSGWSPTHGTWHFQVEIVVGESGRQVIAQGGMATSTEAGAAADAVRKLLGLAEEYGQDADDANRLRLQIIDRIRATQKDGVALPDFEEVRKAVRAGAPVTGRKTVGEWLTEWLAAQGALVENTRRSYASHIDKYLIPHLGAIVLEQLKVSHIQDMFTAIAENADIIPAENAARRAVENAAKKARADRDPIAARAARAKLETMPPYRRPAQAATRQRIRATLRSALSAACSQQLISINVAKLVKLESGKRPKARVWTPERVRRWRATGELPSPVMVWTPEQNRVFMARAERHSHHALYHLVAITGLRRGEVCGLRWSDLDLKAYTMTVSQQIVQMGWDTDITRPKSDAGDREVALDDLTVEILKKHRARQNKAKLVAGEDWIDTDLVFTAPDGSPLHPAWVTDQFKDLIREANLPPIRLHDLRHFAATLMLAAGVDIKVVQETLGHSNSAITRDTYTSVFTELKHAAVNAAAALMAGTRTIGGA